ncbi:alpha/beta fold hydrolase [Paenibacillus sp. LPE1-1-1.1]|uniref:alpha/beta fold hydrolase n=1 Tax=Paenibacillus sp. LPE1-1-1.1 TaxID=3135230 RepID=UPI003442D428
MGIFNGSYHIDRCTSNPDAEAVVLLHGLGLNAQTWEPLVALLTEWYHVVRCELRGHGQCLHDGSELTWELLCEDLDSLFNECGLAEAHVVGHGFGGNLAARYGVSRSERIKTFVLISTFGFYLPEVLDRSVGICRGYAGNGELEVLAEHMASQVTCLPQSREEALWIKEAYLRCDKYVYFQLLELFAAFNPLDDLSVINKPCLVMAGDIDTFYPSFMSKITAQFIQNALSVTVPDAANMLFIDNPVYTAQKILDFLSNPSSGSEIAGIGNPQLGIMSSDVIEAFGNMYTKSKSKEALLRVELIGSFQVFINGKKMQSGWQQRNAKRLLVYLVFHPNAAREQICDALWPLAEGSKASNLLRVSLNHLKALFESAGVSPVIADRRHVKLDAEVECDMLDWIRLLQVARSEENPLTKMNLVKELLNYPVEELFSGLYDNWVLQERGRLEYILLELVESLTDSYKKEGDHSAAYQIMKRLQNIFGEEMPKDVEPHVLSEEEARFH